MTRKEAREKINTAYTPCVILLNPQARFEEENYDALPLGHPVPRDAMIVERWTTANNCIARGFWKQVDTLEDFLNRE